MEQYKKYRLINNTQQSGAALLTVLKVQISNIKVTHACLQRVCIYTLDWVDDDDYGTAATVEVEHESAGC